MKNLLRITNALLAVIALCLVLLVASIYRVDAVTTARAQVTTKAQPVYLVYWDDVNRMHTVVGEDGHVPTKK